MLDLTGQFTGLVFKNHNHVIWVALLFVSDIERSLFALITSDEMCLLLSLTFYLKSGILSGIENNNELRAPLVPNSIGSQ